MKNILNKYVSKYITKYITKYILKYTTKEHQIFVLHDGSLKSDNSHLFDCGHQIHNMINVCKGLASQRCTVVLFVGNVHNSKDLALIKLALNEKDNTNDSGNIILIDSCASNVCTTTDLYSNKNGHVYLQTNATAPEAVSLKQLLRFIKSLRNCHKSMYKQAICISI